MTEIYQVRILGYCILQIMQELCVYNHFYFIIISIIIIIVRYCCCLGQWWLFLERGKGNWKAICTPARPNLWIRLYHSQTRTRLSQNLRIVLASPSDLAKHSTTSDCVCNGHECFVNLGVFTLSIMCDLLNTSTLKSNLRLLRHT